MKRIPSVLRCKVFGLSAAVVLFASASSARAVTFSGLEHTALGGASLDTSDASRLPVRNIGSSGQDGVEINLQGVLPAPGTPFSLDTEIEDLGTLPAGAYLQSQQLGTLGGVPNQVLSTERVTAAAGGYQITTDLSPIWNGNTLTPLIIEYRIGGPTGTVVYTESYDTPNPTFARSNAPNTFYIDTHWDPFEFTMGFDWKNGGGGAMNSARGVPLPSSVDFVDIFAPTNIAPNYSSVQMTGSGLTSFTLLSEVVSVPEPSTIALAVVGLAATSLLSRRRKIA